MAETVLILTGDGELTPEQLGDLKQECSMWNTRAGDFWDKRYEAQRARMCEWDGQSADGRCWDDANGDTETRGLFNGASDLRLRWGDRVTLDKQALLAGALALAQVTIDGTGAAAQRMAGSLGTLLRWMIRDMGARWLREWLALTNWYVGDTPAAAMMAVRWRRDRRIDYRTVTAEELRGMWLAREMARVAPGDEYGAIAAAESVERGMGEMGAGTGGGFNAEAQRRGDAGGMGAGSGGEMAAAVIAQAFGVTMAAARRAAAEIAKEGEAEILVEEEPEEGVELLARRYGDDFVVKDNCRDFEGDAPWFAPEWVGLEELRNRVASEGWDPDFVEAVIAQGEQAVLNNGTECYDVTPAGQSGSTAKTGKRQVVWAYLIGVDGEGRRAKYVTVFGAGERTAFGVRMLRGRRGRWPAVLFQREVRSRYVLESRGVAELAAPAQGMAKSLLDAAANNGMIGGVPPVAAKGYSVRNQYVEPLRIIGMNVNEEFAFMQPPQFPAAALRVVDTIGEDLKDYFGQARKDGDARAVANRERSEVGWFLAQACDVLRMMLEQAQRNAPEGLLAEVTDDRGAPAGLRREDIAGRFRVQVSLNADDMDTEKLMEKMKVTGQVLLAMDRKSVIDTTPLVANALRKMFPDVAEASLRTEEAAGLGEEQEEVRNLESIRAGVMPQMNTDGIWNYEARLGMYRRMAQENPAVFADMAEDKRVMLNGWLEALGQQAVQFGKNKGIGQTGVESVSAE